MSEKLTILEFDAITKEISQRELTTEEITDREQEHQILEAEKQAKEEARTSALAKLAALGLTEEEIAAL